MTTRFGLSLAIILGLAFPALAQQPGAGPCDRGTNRMTIGGVDLDQLRCQAALNAQRMGELDATVTASQAALALAAQDLRAAQERLQQREREWSEFAAPLWRAAPKPE